MYKKWSIIALFSYGFLYFLTSFFVLPASADVMGNSNFDIDTDNITMQGKNEMQSRTNPASSIQSQFNEAYHLEPETADSTLSFTVSQPFVDFGTISSTDPVIRTTDLSVSMNIGGYQILAYEDHALQATPTEIIPDTSCDNGSCTQSESALWSDALTYGFGYRCDNINAESCLNDFDQTDYYRPFANLSDNQTGQAIMQSLLPGQAQKAEITYKVNISGTQPNGNYHNTLTYIAVPGF